MASPASRPCKTVCEALLRIRIKDTGDVRAERPSPSPAPGLRACHLLGISDLDAPSFGRLDRKRAERRRGLREPELGVGIHLFDSFSFRSWASTGIRAPGVMLSPDSEAVRSSRPWSFTNASAEDPLLPERIPVAPARPPRPHHSV
jgi:hypothetical protein